MNVEIPDEILIAGVARAAEALLASENLMDRVAGAIALRLELLEPHAAADLLGVTTRTLQDNHVAWQLDKSLAFGPSNPRYFLSQILSGRGRRF